MSSHVAFHFLSCTSETLRIKQQPFLSSSSSSSPQPLETPILLSASVNFYYVRVLV